LTSERTVLASIAARILEAWAWPAMADAVAFDVPTGPVEEPRADLVVSLPGPDRKPVVKLVLEMRRRLPPLAAADVATQMRQYASGAGAVSVVAAPWLSAQTRQVLERDGVSYADATGNIRIVSEDPLVVLTAAGADRDPTPRTRKTRGLSGERAAEVVRAVLDFAPPYTLSELVDVVGRDIDPSYVTRILQGLAQAELISRERRGPVTDVDVRGLVEQWSTEYDVLADNDHRTFVTMGSASDLASKIARLAADVDIAVTGSLAAVELAPAAAPSLAMIYVQRPEELANQLGLVPADTGWNVVLMVPRSPVVSARTWTRGGLTYCAPSQVAADCLSGPGRMPSEGQALLDWMDANADRWRAPRIGYPTPLEVADAR
jgi:hypothetical protein